MKIDFGERIKIMLAMKNLSQKELAEAINVTQSTISNYCSNTREPDLHTCIAIANVLGVSLDEFLGYPTNIGNKKSSVTILIHRINNKLSVLEEDKLIVLNEFLDEFLESPRSKRKRNKVK